MSHDLDVAVVGAGVAGLTAAHELHRAGLAVRVFEQHDHVAGRMHSFRKDGFTVDEGAEQIPEQGYRTTWELLRRLDVPPGDVPRIGSSLGMWRDGRVHTGVAAPTAPLTGAGLSPRARLDLVRFLGSTARRRRAYDDDHPESTPLGTATLREFTRRYHPDLHDYLLQPVARSFFGWDTARSAAAPLVSLLLAVGRPGTWRTYRDGMDLLARRLAEGLDVVTGSTVHEVVTAGDGVRVAVGGTAVTARAAVLCVPAPLAARLHTDVRDEVRAYLAACTFTPVLKVSCMLQEPLAPAADRPVYALLTPAAEERTVSCVIVDHVKHPARAPAGKGLLTLMAAPPAVPDLLTAPEQQVVDHLTRAACRYVPGLASARAEHHVHRFVHGLPEATPAALRLRARFMARGAGPVEYAGDWVMLRPASEGAVRSGALAASRVLSRLGAPRRTTAPTPTVQEKTP